MVYFQWMAMLPLSIPSVRWLKNMTHWLWLMNVILRELSEKQVGVLQSFIISEGKLTIITGTLGKAFGGAIVALQRVVAKSLNCCVNGRDPTCFQIHFLR
jgi:hypothetical protein